MDRLNSSKLTLALAMIFLGTGCPHSGTGLSLPGGGAVATVASGDTHRPTVATDAKGRIHAVYESLEGGGRPDVMYTFSEDGGKTWSKGVNLSNTPGDSLDPSLAIEDGGALDVVWTDVTAGNESPDIWFTRSSDGGKTWSKPADVSNTPGVSKEPAVDAAADGHVAVVWVDTSAGAASPDVWENHTTDGGTTWSGPKNISDTPGESRQPAVTVGLDNSINVVWIDTSAGAESPDVFFTRSTDGKTFAAPTNVSSSPGVSMSPDIAIDAKGKLYVTWTDTSGSEKSPDVYVAVSSDGQSFSKPLDVSNTPGVSTDPAIAASGDGTVAVVWADTSGGDASPDVWMTSSTDGGKTFGAPVDISRTPGVSRLPDVTIAGSNAVVVWEEAEGGKGSIKAVTVPLK